MSSYDQWLDGSTPDWTAIVQTLFGVIVMGFVGFVVGIIDLVRRGIDAVLGGLSRFIEDVLVNTILVPLSPLEAAGDELISFLEIFGPFAFIVAIVVTTLSTYIVVQAILIARDWVLGVF